MQGNEKICISYGSFVACYALRSNSLAMLTRVVDFLPPSCGSSDTMCAGSGASGAVSHASGSCCCLLSSLCVPTARTAAHGLCLRQQAEVCVRLSACGWSCIMVRQHYVAMALCLIWHPFCATTCMHASNLCDTTLVLHASGCFVLLHGGVGLLRVLHKG